MHQTSFQNGSNQSNSETATKLLKFVDLNSDVQLNILESLPIEDLLSLSETSQYFSSLTVGIFKKYLHTFVEVKSKLNRLSDDKGRIYARDEQTARRLFKHFGRLISKLKVNYAESSDMDATTLQSISKAIDFYCSDTLKEIIIFDKSHSFFGQITKPFKNIERVELFGHYKNLSGGSLSFSEIFPSMKSLFLSSTTFKHIDQIFHHYPNLIELRVNFYDMFHSRNVKETDIAEIIEKNPQIRILKVHSSTSAILKNASDALPNLEHLRIEPSWHLEISNNGPEILFKNVKILELKPTENKFHIRRFLRGIKFESLEELRAIINPEVEFDWWLKFIRKNTNLKIFHIIEGSINDDDIVKFTKTKTTNLNEISITLDSNVKDESLIDFVNKHHTTERFVFKFDESDDGDCEMKISALREKFNDQWIIMSSSDSFELTKH